MILTVYTKTLHLRCLKWLWASLCSDCTWQYFVSSSQISDGIFWIPTRHEDNLPSCEYLWKIALAICLQKTRKSRDSLSTSLLTQYITHAPNPHAFKKTGTNTIILSGYHSCNWTGYGPFCWQNPCSGFNIGIDLVVAIE